jgi:hypothetical protein
MSIGIVVAEVTAGDVDVPGRRLLVVTCGVVDATAGIVVVVAIGSLAQATTDMPRAMTAKPRRTTQR